MQRLKRFIVTSWSVLFVSLTSFVVMQVITQSSSSLDPNTLVARIYYLTLYVTILGIPLSVLISLIAIPLLFRAGDKKWKALAVPTLILELILVFTLVVIVLGFWSQIR
jgi:hypothetical protein